MNDLIIREMKEQDIDEIIEIERLSFSTPWSREAFVIEMTTNKLAKYIVAEKNGKLIGYAGLWFIIDEGHITNIAVKPEYRGQGVGASLVKELIDISEERGIPSLTLEVRKSNIVAKSLYQKYGFENCGIRPGYYSDTKEDAIIMWRNKNNC